MQFAVRTGLKKKNKFYLIIFYDVNVFERVIYIDRPLHVVIL